MLTMIYTWPQTVKVKGVSSSLYFLTLTSSELISILNTYLPFPDFIHLGTHF